MGLQDGLLVISICVVDRKICWLLWVWVIRESTVHRAEATTKMVSTTTSCRTNRQLILTRNVGRVPNKWNGTCEEAEVVLTKRWDREAVRQEGEDREIGEDSREEEREGGEGAHDLE